jgi:ABC-2 type transport system ATP-binding protein
VSSTTSTPQYSVEVENLKRVFDKFVAVAGISFRVREGQIFGFLGPNGAGKSTTIRMLTGILPPTSGSGRVAGFDIIKERRQIKQAIGYMSQKFSLYEDLTVRENLRFFSGVYGADAVDWAVDVCHIGKVMDTLCSALSVGLRQRAALACAVVHRPRIVFLDEPTAGVDPTSRRSFWELIYTLAKNGVTVFVSTHYMDEAEHCDALALIDQGKIVASGSPRELRTQYFHASLLEVDCESMFLWLDDLAQQPGIEEVAMYGNKLHVTVADPTAASAQIRELGERKNLRVLSIREIQPSLEDIFVSVMTQQR